MGWSRVGRDLPQTMACGTDLSWRPLRLLSAVCTAFSRPTYRQYWSACFDVTPCWISPSINAPCPCAMTSRHFHQICFYKYLFSDQQKNVKSDANFPLWKNVRSGNKFYRLDFLLDFQVSGPHVDRNRSPINTTLSSNGPNWFLENRCSWKCLDTDVPMFT